MTNGPFVFATGGTMTLVDGGTLTLNGHPVGYVVAPLNFTCLGDGSQFCCARNGCHAVCNCKLSPTQEVNVVVNGTIDIERVKAAFKKGWTGYGDAPYADEPLCPRCGEKASAHDAELCAVACE